MKKINVFSIPPIVQFVKEIVELAKEDDWDTKDISIGFNKADTGTG